MQARSPTRNTKTTRQRRKNPVSLFNSSITSKTIGHVDVRSIIPMVRDANAGSYKYG